MRRPRVRPRQPAPGRPRGPALRTLRSVRREPAGRRRSLIFVRKRGPGLVRRLPPLMKTPRWSAERREAQAQRASNAPRKRVPGRRNGPGGESPVRLPALRPPRLFGGNIRKGRTRRRRGAAPARPPFIRIIIQPNHRKRDATEQAERRRPANAQAAQDTRRVFAQASPPATISSAAWSRRRRRPRRHALNDLLECWRVCAKPFGPIRTPGSGRCHGYD